MNVERHPARSLLSLVSFLAVALLAFGPGVLAAADCNASDAKCQQQLAQPCPFPGTPMTYPGVCHPYPQPRPDLSIQTTAGCTVANSATCCDGIDGCLTRIATGEGIYPACNPFCFATFPGNNLLPNVYTNAFDGAGNEIPNTLPSTPDVPYNLHDGDPLINAINPTSPADDLGRAFAETLTRAFALLELGRELDTDAPAADELARLRDLVWRNVPLVGYHDLLGTLDTDRRRGPTYDAGELEVERGLLADVVRNALDVIEGNPVANRAYSGFPLLHYNGPEKLKRVVPIRDGAGRIVGGNVDVHQIWYGQHIESDTGVIDTSPLVFDDQCQRLKDADGSDLNVTWTVTYTVDVLNRGHDDFSPFVIYVDPFAPDPQHPGQTKKAPHVGMDQTFFDMEDGTRTVFKIKMAPADYLTFVYTWGWRMHPPRIQVMDHASNTVDYGDYPFPGCRQDYQGCGPHQLEQAVFCNPEAPPAASTPPAAARCQTSGCGIGNLTACSTVRCGPDEPRYDESGQPTPCRRDQLYAISKIGGLSPAKRMWQALRQVQQASTRGDYAAVIRLVDERGLPAFYDWQDRTLLPDGVEEDPESDITILYVNNTLYGQLTDGAVVRWNEWEKRPATLKVTAYNADHFVHGYNVADFGGNRGWENQFKSSVKVAGSGCWFTFGRAHWWPPAGGANGYLCVPPAAARDGESVACGYDDDGHRLACGRHRFELTFNFDPSRRLRFYQFDPFHHDVAIFSIH